MRKIYFVCIFIVNLLSGCNSKLDLQTEKIQKNRNRIVNIEEKIVDISINQYFKWVDLYIVDEYLLIVDVYGISESVFYLYDKTTFNFIGSAGIPGKGPCEITRAGEIGYDDKKRIIWLNDHGQMAIWEFPLDSILQNDRYKPTNKKDISSKLFVLDFYFLNDSIAIGKGISPLTHNSFEMATVMFNIKANNIEKFGYVHPKAIGRHVSNSYFTLSRQNSTYVSCHNSIDLMTICDLDGNLKYNIYGPNWTEKISNEKKFYCGVVLFNNYIITSYLGDNRFIYDENERPKSNLPTSFVVFDKDGNYKITLKTGNRITDFCVDKENSRLIVYFDKDNPLGYIDLNNIEFAR